MTSGEVQQVLTAVSDVKADLGEVKGDLKALRDDTGVFKLETVRALAKIEERVKTNHCVAAEAKNDAREAGKKAGGVLGSVAGAIAALAVAIASWLLRSLKG